MDKTTYRIAGALANVVDVSEDLMKPREAYDELIEVSENYDLVDICETILILDEDDQRVILQLLINFIDSKI